MCVCPSINEKIYYWSTNVVLRQTRPFSAQLCLAQALRSVGVRPGTAALKFMVSNQRDADLCGRKQRRPKLSWGKVRNSWVGEVPKAGKDNKLVLSRLVVLFCFVCLEWDLEQELDKDWGHFCWDWLLLWALLGQANGGPTCSRHVSLVQSGRWLHFVHMLPTQLGVAESPLCPPFLNALLAADLDCLLALGPPVTNFTGVYLAIN